MVNIVIEFNESAFQHRMDKEDIYHAVLHPVYDDIWDTAADKHLLIGFDRKFNLLEIMYNTIDEHSINVFHAMKCRNSVLKLLGR